MPTSCLSGATVAGLCDELTKIAEEREPRWKRVAKTVAPYAAGSAIGYGAAGGAEYLASKLFKNKWPKLSPKQRWMILAPAGALAGTAAAAAHQHFEKKRQEAMADG